MSTQTRYAGTADAKSGGTVFSSMYENCIEQIFQETEVQDLDRQKQN
jgi:hypothetical protein